MEWGEDGYGYDTSLADHASLPCTVKTSIYRANVVIYYLKKDICYMLMQPGVHELAVRHSILVIL